MTDNVIQLPVSNRKKPATSMEEAYASIEEARKEQISMICSGLIEYAMHEIIEAGYPVGDPKCMADHFAMVAAMQAMMCRSVGIYHPLHDITEHMFEFRQVNIDDNGDEIA